MVSIKVITIFLIVIEHELSVTEDSSFFFWIRLFDLIPQEHLRFDITCFADVDVDIEEGDWRMSGDNDGHRCLFFVERLCSIIDSIVLATLFDSDCCYCSPRHSNEPEAFLHHR